MLRAMLGSFVGAVIGLALGSRIRLGGRGEKTADRSRARECSGWVSPSGRQADLASARAMCGVYHRVARWNLDQYYKYVTYSGGAIGGVLAWAVVAFVKHHSDPASGWLGLVFPLAWWLQWNVSKLLDKQYRRWLQNLVLAAKCEYIMGLHGAVRPPADAGEDRPPWPRDGTFQVDSFYAGRNGCRWRTSREYVCHELNKQGNLLHVGQRTLRGLTVGAFLFALLTIINWGRLLCAVEAP